MTRRDEYKELREQGKTLREIAELYGVTKQAVSYALHHPPKPATPKDGGAKRARPGRPKGPQLRPHPGSYPDLFSSFAVGERRYVEETPENPNLVHTITAAIQKSPVLKGRKFSTTKFTAVGAKNGEIRVLICVERVQ